MFSHSNRGRWHGRLTDSACMILESGFNGTSSYSAHFTDIIVRTPWSCSLIFFPTLVFFHNTCRVEFIRMLLRSFQVSGVWSHGDTKAWRNVFMVCRFQTKCSEICSCPLDWRTRSETASSTAIHTLKIWQSRKSSTTNHTGNQFGFSALYYFKQYSWYRTASITSAILLCYMCLSTQVTKWWMLIMLQSEACSVKLAL